MCFFIARLFLFCVFSHGAIPWSCLCGRTWGHPSLLGRSFRCLETPGGNFAEKRWRIPNSPVLSCHPLRRWKPVRIKSQALKGIKHNSITGLQQKHLFNWSWALSTQVFCPYALRVSHMFKEFGICRCPYYTSTSAAVDSTDLGAFAWEVPTRRDAQVKFFSSPK